MVDQDSHLDLMQVSHYCTVLYCTWVFVGLGSRLMDDGLGEVGEVGGEDS
jgi:hypothetical protein